MQSVNHRSHNWKVDDSWNKHIVKWLDGPGVQIIEKEVYF